MSDFNIQFEEQDQSITLEFEQIGGGAVKSVNGKTGVVVLDADDVGAYTKPSGGIPKTDLASAVQTSLGKADSAYQKPSGGIPAGDIASDVVPAVDNTLAISGAAADAKKTGDEIATVKDGLGEATEQTYNLVVGKLTGLTVNSSGGMVNWGGTTDMIIAPVVSNKTYTIKTDDASGFVGAFYNSIPTASTTASYNDSRVIQTNKTFTAPISGYVAFRVSTGYAYAQIVEGSSDKDYIAPRTALDVIARANIDLIESDVNGFSERTYNLVIGKKASLTINSSGQRAGNNLTDLWVAPIVQDKSYIVQTKGSAGLVYGFFVASPLEDAPVVTYNNSRSIASGAVYTFTAPITGYIAFTSSANATEIQISEGSDSKPYLPPTTTAIDIIARNMGGNVLEGKILCCCGDSITYGADMDSDGITNESKILVYQSNNSGVFSQVTSGFLKTWNWQIAERNNMTLYNAGVSGSTMQGIADKNGFSLANGRYTKLPDHIDYLLIWFGWNDTAYGSLGAITDTTNESYYGGYNVVIPYLIDKYPYAKIALIVPFGTDANHRNAIRQLGNKWGVAVWDNYQGGTPLYYGKEPSVGVEQSIVTANQAKFQANGAHPNYKGHTQLADMIEEFLRGI